MGLPLLLKVVGVSAVKPVLLNSKSKTLVPLCSQLLAVNWAPSWKLRVALLRSLKPPEITPVEPTLIVAPFLLFALPVFVVAKAKIGGQTGDVLGASQKFAEMATLAATLAL